jgi:hypothetical protein
MPKECKPVPCGTPGSMWMEHLVDESRWICVFCGVSFVCDDCGKPIVQGQCGCIDLPP